MMVNSEVSMSNLWAEFVSNERASNLYLETENPDVFFEQFKRNFIIVEAAGGVVYNVKKELLCIYRFGKWDLPKGKIEKGEEIEEAAIREVEEETGISGLRIVEQKETTFHIYSSPYHNNNWVLKPTYWFKMQYKGDQKLTPQLAEDITHVEWIGKNDISKVRAETYASLVALFDND